MSVEKALTESLKKFGDGAKFSRRSRVVHPLCLDQFHHRRPTVVRGYRPLAVPSSGVYDFENFISVASIGHYEKFNLYLIIEGRVDVGYRYLAPRNGRSFECTDITSLSHLGGRFS